MTFGEKLTKYLLQTGESDSRYGLSLSPKVGGGTVWKWRHDKSEPARQYRSQIIKLSEQHRQTGIFFTPEDFI